MYTKRFTGTDGYGGDYPSIVPLMPSGDRSGTPHLTWTDRAALDAAEPGVTCEAVEKAWRETIARYDIEKEDRIGCSMRLGCPPDWGEHTASLRPGDETVLEEGMTFHVIPGIWGDDFGVAISETFHVERRRGGVADFPRKLFTT